MRPAASSVLPASASFSPIRLSVFASVSLSGSCVCLRSNSFRHSAKPPFATFAQRTRNESLFNFIWLIFAFAFHGIFLVVSYLWLPTYLHRLSRYAVYLPSLPPSPWKNSCVGFISSLSIITCLKGAWEWADWSVCEPVGVCATS